MNLKLSLNTYISIARQDIILKIFYSFVFFDSHLNFCLFFLIDISLPNMRIIGSKCHNGLQRLIEEIHSKFFLQQKS